MSRSITSVLVAAACLMLCSSVQAYITTPSDTFANQYNGDEIWDGANFLNDWNINGGATAASLSLNGSVLVVNNDDNNGWIEHDTGATPWEAGIGAYAVEVSAKLTDNDLGLNDNFVIWAAANGSRQVVVITANAVTDLAGNVLADGFDNTDDFHAYRVNFDPADTSAGPEGSYQVLRDGALLATIGRQDVTNSSRLIVGDCCTSIGNPVDTYEIDYVRYEVVPEPTSIALLGFGLVGIAALRRNCSRMS